LTLRVAEDDSLILRREIDSGREKPRFCQRQACQPFDTLACREFLVDVHGQHEHQSLIRPAAQRHLLDSFGSLEALRAEGVGNYHALRALIAIKGLNRSPEQEKQRLIESIQLSGKEIRRSKAFARVKRRILSQCLPTLKNVEKLRELGEENLPASLRFPKEAIVEKLGRGFNACLKISANIGQALSEPAENNKETLYQIEEAAREVENFRDSLNADPERLNELLVRQDLFGRLKKKYGPTVEEILATGKRPGATCPSLRESGQTGRN